MVFERFIVLRADSFQNRSGFTIHSVIVFFFFLFFSLFLLLLEKFLFFWRGETTERPRIFIYSHNFRMHFMKPKYFINLLIRCNKFKYIYLFIHFLSVSLIFEIIYLYNIRRKSSLN